MDSKTIPDVQKSAPVRKITFLMTVILMFFLTLNILAHYGFENMYFH